MHMSDALLSPTVGVAFWAVSAVAVGHAARHLHRDPDDPVIPLMGVLGAFVFAVQMLNFALPGTGSSGHLTGAVLLSILLGPTSALLVMASVLTVQCLLFADGGLLALGANIFNLAVVPCLVVYHLVYRPIAGRVPTPGRVATAAVAAAIVSAQLGAFGVVAQTSLSGIAELPFQVFALVMQPLHLIVGAVEGFVTVLVLRFLTGVDPQIRDLVHGSGEDAMDVRAGAGRAVIVLALAAALGGGMIAWSASTAPDALESSVAHVAQADALPVPDSPVHSGAARVQSRSALLPDYELPPRRGEGADDLDSPARERIGTSLSALVGGGLVMMLALLLGATLRHRRRRGVQADAA